MTALILLKSFSKKELYAKVFSQLREIISDDLIDEVAFKKKGVLSELPNR